MSRGPWVFKQRDLTRAVKGVVAAGLPVYGVEVDKNGKIVVITDKAKATTNGADTEKNEWDCA